MTVLKASEIAVDPDCGRRHLGRCGGLTFAQRLRSVQVDGAALETRSKRDYFDDDALVEVFGHDKRERAEIYMDETKGEGAVTASEIRAGHPRVQRLLDRAPIVDET